MSVNQAPPIMNKKRTKKLRKELLEILSKHKDKMKHFKYCFRKAKKAYKAGLLTLLLTMCLSVNIAFADKLQIPFSCYPKKVQAVFMEYGLKLDLDGNDRTPESWGFLKNEGSEFWLYTYRGVTTEELEFIRDIMWECLE